jgi:CheY-like chemotaxis protein
LEISDTAGWKPALRAVWSLVFRAWSFSPFVQAESVNKFWRFDGNRLSCHNLSLDLKAPAFPQRRILVVDDEPLVCEAVKMMLAFDGHVVQTTSSGKEALDILNSEKFDLIITDFKMPGMRGDELAAAIKARDPKQPVVMITAYAEMLKGSGNPLTGVDMVISKPFLLENLREAVSKTCGNESAEPGSN